jgi:DNA-binding PadR family transcriptional regulator
LHRLERAKLVEAEWGLSENNRQAKFYSLSAAGRRRLKSGTTAWHAFVDAASRALRSAAPEIA